MISIHFLFQSYILTITLTLIEQNGLFYANNWAVQNTMRYDATIIQESFVSG